MKVLIKNNLRHIGRSLKEYLRKKFVHLKRNPQLIPLLLLVISCCIYTFKLTAHSNATMYVMNKIIAFNLFVTTLTSMMAIFSFIAVKKLNKSARFSIIITVILICLQLFLDIFYLKTMHFETVLRAVPFPVTDDIKSSILWIWIHVCFLALTLLSIILLPVYKKLLQKIDTSVKANLPKIDNLKEFVEDEQLKGI